ncbi:hypothetical protein SKAU_G00259780 [Synaphobranchus kaupii]|uniref:Uncharacterized protein n=1 Tax=Synaphobranchus kaupii TaxID=118154 RepID=A0A9Q1F4G4_SYNKA|nr:hypothetical protein SKAU_G00259780 [Synaphobranchus kaupii]
MAMWVRFLQFSALCTFLLSGADKRVFQSQIDANAILQRPRRSNSFLLEEILQGSLERECYEERCNYEEAREHFEDLPKTDAFWTVYYDGDQCNPNPCLNGANCTDKIGGYNCDCKELYDGVNCERDVSQCHSEGPLSCDHFCRPAFNSYHCSCAEGYGIHTDGRTCLPAAQDPCGRAPAPRLNEQNRADPRSSPRPRLSQQNPRSSPASKLSEKNWTGSDSRSSPSKQLCLQGRCPWQVRLLDAAGREICSGVILGKRSVLTSAACASRSKTILVALGEKGADEGQQVQVWPDEEPRPPSRDLGQVSPVSQVSLHKRYRQGEPGDDLALLQVYRSIRPGSGVFHTCLPEKDFSEQVLMEPGGDGWVAGALLSYLPLEECQSSLNLSFPLTNKMFCMAGGWRGCGACGGGLPPGTPVVSVRKNTAFLTGLLTTPQTHNCSRGHVFTKLSRYLPWIRQQLELSEK